MDPATFADTYLDITNRSGNEVAFRCPVHNDRNASASFNIESGLWLCYSCSAKGSIKTLARHLGVPYVDGSRDNLGELFAKIDKLGRRKLNTRTPVISEKVLDRYAFPTRYWSHDRKFNNDIIDMFELGYDPMQNVASIPQRNMEGELIGVLRRSLDVDPDRKYLEPKGMKKSHHLFGAWLVADHETHQVVVTEGSTDAMKLWQAGIPAVAQCGAYISKTQIRILRKLGLTTIVLFYDNDRAGKEATSYAQGFSTALKFGKKTTDYDPEHDLRRFFLVKTVKYPRHSGKDPDSLNADQLRAAVDNAKYVI